MIPQLSLSWSRIQVLVFYVLHVDFRDFHTEFQKMIEISVLTVDKWTGNVNVNVNIGHHCVQMGGECQTKICYNSIQVDGEC